MRYSMIQIGEMIVGAILMGVALVYLSFQFKAINNLTGVVKNVVLEDESLYQQGDYIDIGSVSDEELAAVTMGYREYPIVIDGVVIKVDGVDYEYYLELIREGFYKKTYGLNAIHEIVQIVYTYVGA